MPPIGLDYPPIAKQPAYKAEADKLNRFVKQQADAEKRLADLHAQLEQSKKIERTEEDAISKAEALLTGEERGVDLHAEIRATNSLIEALRNAQKAQHAVIRGVIAQLAQAAGRRYEDEHKKRVKRVMAAMDELYAANQAEESLRDDLVRLGYTATALPAMNFCGVEDPRDRNGNASFYWYREAERYSQSAEEIAADLRKLRLKAMAGE
ncbi:hypothetical protein ASC93_11095 [Massilia sp. Root335]|nr:hypothetical protein ASC93_11095 [Massilia sp. Root335]